MEMEQQVLLEMGSRRANTRPQGCHRESRTDRLASHMPWSTNWP